MSLCLASDGIEEINYNGVLFGIKLNGVEIKISYVTPTIS